jgi:voltage-gated potassium channel
MKTFEAEESGVDVTKSEFGMFETEDASVGKLGDSSAGPKGALTMQRRIFITLDEPDSGLAARLISSAIMLMIFASSVSFVMETTPTVRSDPDLQSNLRLLENVCIIVFTIEYVLRVACCTHRLTPDPSFIKYVRKPMNMVDLLAIAPFWIELVFAGDLSLGVLRMLRMTRIFRVLKIGSFADELQLFSNGMSRASEGLLLLFFMLLLYFCVFATLLFLVENQAQIDCRSCPTCGCPAWRGFTSIPTTMYFIMATMTTVGYGDMYPITQAGQILCGLCMLWCA